MTDTFAVGEVAIAQNLTVFPEDNGLEVVVLSPLRFTEAVLLRLGIDTCGYTYLVRWPNGLETEQLPHTLRKKPPKQKPREEVGEWELCPWQPESCTVGKRDVTP